MNPITQKAFALLREVKSVTFATLDNGQPAARIVDVMLNEKDGLYFLTARGKSFYRQLKASPQIAICGMNKNYVTARIVGRIQFCDNRAIIDEIFAHNPVMKDLYPGEKRDILEGIHLYQGKGEIFNLSVAPPERERFAFGGEVVNPPGYAISDRCTACGMCLDECPVAAICEGDPYRIDAGHCLECGRCVEFCPENAIIAAAGL